MKSDFLPKYLQKRPPVVAIMGHVDHGKTTMLDWIRKTRVAAKEAGGITQSIGAYEIEHNSSKVTFIDTPGHEAFKAMRVYGTKAADLAVLVVAADDGVKPQTKEALGCILETKLPYLVAINKIDKSNADIEKTKNDLAQIGVLLESRGGTISWQAVSAKTGEGMNDLLELILLSADLQDLSWNSENPACGFVIKSFLESKRGIAASVIIKDGILKKGQAVKTPSAAGRVKLMENFLGKPVSELKPSAPALIIGFEKNPNVGEQFTTDQGAGFADKTNFASEEKKVASASNEVQKDPSQKLNVVIKADENSSLDAIKSIVEKINKTGKVLINVTAETIGPITENDIKKALHSSAIICALRTKTDKAAAKFAKNREVEIFSSDVIYKLENQLNDRLASVLKPPAKIVEILAVFSLLKNRTQIIGGRVLEGFVQNRDCFEIFKDENLLGSGAILNLQSGGKNVNRAGAGEEVGLLVESKIPIETGFKFVLPPASKKK